MTALCGGGTSGPKPGVNELVIFSSSMLGSRLSNLGGLWATLALGALGVVTYEATQLCQTDPPPVPTILPAEYQALLDLGPPDVLLTATGKLKDLVTNSIWRELCECTSVATPPAPTTLLQQPAGVTVPNFASGPCAQPRAQFTHVANALHTDPTHNVTRQLFPQLEFVQSVPAGSGIPAQDIAIIPANWATMHSTIQLVSGTTPSNQGCSVVLSTYDATRVFNGDLNTAVCVTPAPFQRWPATGETAFDRGTQFYFSVGTAVTNLATQPCVTNYELTIACAGSPISQLSCSNDPVLMALLNSILESVNQARSDITQLQRFALPFGYVRGPQVTGLTGTGSRTIGRSVGLLLNVGTFPPTNKQFLGEPPYIFDLGWVSCLTADGMVDETRLTRENMAWLSKLIPSATTVGWGLRDGVTLSITELHAEP